MSSMPSMMVWRTSMQAKDRFYSDRWAVKRPERCALDHRDLRALYSRSVELFSMDSQTALERERLPFAELLGVKFLRRPSSMGFFWFTMKTNMSPTHAFRIGSYPHVRLPLPAGVRRLRGAWPGTAGAARSAACGFAHRRATSGGLSL
jgi:hypothetical protein